MAPTSGAAPRSLNVTGMPSSRQTEAISEPFMTLLLEVSWSRGHLVREYTMADISPDFPPTGGEASKQGKEFSHVEVLR